MRVEPVIHDYLTQIFIKHYKLEPTPAAEQALRFLEIIELYQMQLIMGEWVVPVPIEVKKLTGWDKLILSNMDIIESGREPWLAKEIQ